MKKQMKNKIVYLAPAIQVKLVAVENGFELSNADIAIVEAVENWDDITF
jgi:hypothetical protein